MISQIEMNVKIKSKNHMKDMFDVLKGFSNDKSFFLSFLIWLGMNSLM